MVTREKLHPLLGFLLCLLLVAALGCSSGSAITNDVDNGDDTDTDDVGLVGLDASSHSGAAPFNVRFTANSANFATGTTLTFDYDFDGDGDYDLLNGGTTPPQQTYATPGTYTVKVRIRSSNGNWMTMTTLVIVVPSGTIPSGTVSSGGPVARIAAYPSTVAAGGSVSLDGTGSYDPDGSIARYDWDTDGDGVYNVLNSTSSLAKVSFAQQGTYLVALRVADNKGLISECTTRVTVTAGSQDTPIDDDSLPTAWLMAFPSSGPAPLTVSLDASGSWAANGGALVFDWDVEGDGTYDILNGSETISHVYSTAGTFKPKVRVTDTNSASSTQTTTITVTAGLEQIHAQMYVYPVTGTAPLTVTLEANGSWSIDGAALSFEFDPEGDGTYQASTTQVLISHTYTQVGTYVPRLRVTDAKSRTATTTGATVTVTAAASSVPLAKLSATPTSGSAPLNVSFNATGSTDADHDIQNYMFDYQGDGLYDTVNTTGTATYSYQTAGSYTAVVLVRDAQSHTSTATVAITVSNAPSSAPVAKLTATPTSGPAPLSVSFSAAGSTDADNDIQNYLFDFTGDGLYDTVNATGTASYTYTTSGTYTAAVLVQDKQNHTGTATVTVTVNAASGSAPVARLTAVPTSGTAPLSVVLNATTSSDADNDIQSYMFDFQNDGAYDTVNTTGTAAFTYTNAGTFTAKVLVQDKQSHSSTATVVITVSAAGSSVPVAKLTAVPVSGSAPLIVAFDATASTDADGDITNYMFDFQGDGLLDAVNATGIATFTYSADGTYTATVIVQDELYHTSSATVVISVSTQSGGPCVILDASNYSGTAPLTTTFTAGYSYSTGSAIDTFDWDLDNNGSFELLDAGPEQTTTFTTAGEHTVKVRVTDYKNRQAVGSCTVYVS